MNLSTAKASQRVKEVGIKKAMGASRKALIRQYLGESMLMTFLSLLTALLLVQLLLSQFNEITGKQLTLQVEATLILALLGITIGTGLIAGSYPAVYLSKFNPALVLKGKFNSSVGELWARKGLVVFQFTVSVIFVVAVLVVYKQIEYIQNKHVGYDKDHVIYFEPEGKVVTHVEPFLAEVKKLPGVVTASSMFGNIVGGFNHGQKHDLPWEGKDIPVNRIGVNYDMLETLGMEMADGRTFSRKFGSDDSKIILNETAVKSMGLKNPVGQTLQLWGKDVEIIGVVKDFHYESLYEQVKPFIFRLDQENSINIMVKVQAGKEKEVTTAPDKFLSGL